MKITLAFIFGLLGWGSTFCQTITFSQFYYGIGTIDIANGFNIDGPYPIQYDNVNGGPPHSMGGITFHPDGKLYGASENLNWFLKVNLENTNGTLQYIGDFGGCWRMTSAPDGTVYGTYIVSLMKSSVEGNQNDEWITVGVDSNMLNLGPLTMVNGELYVASFEPPTPIKNSIVKVNFDDPLHSEEVLALPDGVYPRAMTTFNVDCDSSVTYLASYNAAGTGYNIFKLTYNPINFSFVKEISGITSLVDFANPTEYLHFDCKPILDLTGQDGTALDFQAAKTCITPDQRAYPFAEAPVSILTNTIVDSIWVGIDSGNLDGNAESLGCESNSFAASTPNNGGIMLHNTGQVNNAELLEWFRQSVFYQNSADLATTGTRNIAVVAYNHDYASDTAYLILPIQVGVSAIAEIGNPSSLTANDGSISLLELTGSGQYQFLWSNGAATRDIAHLAPGNYTVTISDGTGCEATYSFVLEVASAVNAANENPLGATVVPNPSGAQGAKLTLTMATSQTTWTLFDATGRQIANDLIKGNTAELPNGLLPGVYILEVKGQAWRTMLKWVVQ